MPQFVLPSSESALCNIKLWHKRFYDPKPIDFIEFYKQARVGALDRWLSGNTEDPREGWFRNINQAIIKIPEGRIIHVHPDHIYWDEACRPEDAVFSHQREDNFVKRLIIEDFSRFSLTLPSDPVIDLLTSGISFFVEMDLKTLILGLIGTGVATVKRIFNLDQIDKFIGLGSSYLSPCGIRCQGYLYQIEFNGFSDWIDSYMVNEILRTRLFKERGASAIDLIF